MNQNLWGPQLWFFLHTISFNYPLKPSNEDKDKIISFLYGLQPVIPCKVCRDHFKRNLAEIPAKLDSRKDFSEWMIDTHNEINSRTGKKTISYDEAINISETNFGNNINLTSDIIDTCKCKSNYDVKNLYMYFLLFLVIIVFIVYYKKYK